MSANSAIIANSVEYLLYETVERLVPIYCRGSKRSSMLIERHKIAKDNYAYIKDKGANQWELCAEETKPGRYVKLAFRKDFIDGLPEMQAQRNAGTASTTTMPQYAYAPAIINLVDAEKFKDAEGNVIEIETRGERKHDRIYFRVKDVAAGFGMDPKNLCDTIVDKHTMGYIESIHYKSFYIRPNAASDRSKSDMTQNIKKDLFLTYLGMMRLLFVSRSKSAESFTKWAAEVLFTMQMGSKKERRTLASSLLGVDAQTIKEVFNADARSMPCVYLFSLGYVRDLRESMAIPAKYADDSIVLKYGRTNELARRTAEHLNTFSAIKGAELRLMHYAYVDPQYLVEAEGRVRATMDNTEHAFKYENMEELAIIPQALMDMVKDKYENIAQRYSGHASELIAQIREMENERKNTLSMIERERDNMAHQRERERDNMTHQCERERIEHQLELERRDAIITALQKDAEIASERHARELMAKELEVMKAKLEASVYGRQY